MPLDYYGICDNFLGLAGAYYTLLVNTTSVYDLSSERIAPTKGSDHNPWLMVLLFCRLVGDDHWRGERNKIVSVARGESKPTL